MHAVGNLTVRRGRVHSLFTRTAMRSHAGTGEGEIVMHRILIITVALAGCAVVPTTKTTVRTIRTESATVERPDATNAVDDAVRGVRDAVHSATAGVQSVSNSVLASVHSAMDVRGHVR